MRKIIFLGTGASTGVPVIACKCSTCKSKLKYNKRLRSSILVQVNGINILIDATPDIRQQALNYKIDKLDALIISHVHFDHVGGLDDLRIYNRIQKKNIKCFISKSSFKELKIKYSHFFKKNQVNHTTSAKFDFEVLKERKKNFAFKDLEFNYFTYFQDDKKVLGIRLDNFAYITDIKKYDEKILKSLENLDILVLSCLKKEKSLLHFNLKEAYDFAEKINPKKVYFTHIAHEIEHRSFSNKLLKNFQLAYDGLKLNF